MTCATNQTPSHVAHPPHTLINRSLRHLRRDEAIWRPSHLKHKQHQRRFRSTEVLLESSPEDSRNFKNFDLKCKERSNQNHLNYLPRSQRSLESSSKAFRNLNNSQISKALRIQASKASKNFHHKPSNTKNIRRGIIQIIFLDLKVHWNQAQKPLESSTNHKSVKLYGFKPLKPQRTSTTNLRR